MRHITLVAVLLLALGINTKCFAQARFTSFSHADATTPASSTTSSHDVHASAPTASINSVKETPVSAYHNVSAANIPPAINHTSTSTAAGGTTSSPLSSGAYHGPAIVFAAATRYSPVAKQPYPYYSTPVTRYKSEKHTHRHPHTKGKIVWPSPFFCVPEFLFSYDFETVWEEESMDDDNNTATKGGSVLNTSLDGYVVNRDDTLSGIVTMTEKAIYLEQPIDDKHETGYMFLYTDNNVKEVAVFEGNNSLYLGHAGGTGRLSRVIHNGKLCIYDDHYNFLLPGNIHKTKLSAAYNGQVKSPKLFGTADSKQLLIESINAAYGLQLEAKDFTWNQLLKYLDDLD